TAEYRAVVGRLYCGERKFRAVRLGNGDGVALPLVAQWFATAGAEAEGRRLAGRYRNGRRLRGDVRRRFAGGSIRNAHERTGVRLELIILHPRLTVQTIQTAVEADREIDRGSQAGGEDAHRLRISRVENAHPVVHVVREK